MAEKNQKVKKIIKEISLLTCKDERVVQSAAYHPLLFFKRVMEDDYDDRAVRIKYLGIFFQKYKMSKGEIMKKRFNKLINKIEEVYESCKENYPEFQNHMEFESFLWEVYNSKNWESINFLNKKYKDWKRKQDVTNTEYLKL